MSETEWKPIESAKPEKVGCFDEPLLIGYAAWSDLHHVGPIAWWGDHWEFKSIEFDVFPHPTHWRNWPHPRSLTDG